MSERVNESIKQSMNIFTLPISRQSSSPFTSPQASGPVDSQVLMSALARLRQGEAVDRSLSSPSPDLYSPDVRSPDRSLNFGNSLNSSINGGRLVTTGRGTADSKMYS